MATGLFSEQQLRDLYEGQRLSLTAIARLRGCHPSSVWTHLRTHDIARRSISEAKIKHSRRPFSGDAIEQSYLVGFRVGDLHVYKANHSETSQTITVACTSTRSEQIELLTGLFKPYGGIHLSVGPKQTVITCFLDLSFSFLLSKPPDVPSWILASRDCFSAFLAGYIDAEGCIQIKRSTRSAEMVLRSYDRQILQTCQTMLQELGVTCPPVHLIKRRGQRDGNGPPYHQDYWGFGVYQQQSIDRLFTLIGPYMRHAKRRRDMLAAWEHVRIRLGYPEEV